MISIIMSLALFFAGWGVFCAGHYLGYLKGSSEPKGGGWHG
jgi:hypothetical protein